MIWSKYLLNKVKYPEEPNMFFFVQVRTLIYDQRLNRSNGTDDVPGVMNDKFPSSVIVLGVMSN